MMSGEIEERSGKVLIIACGALAREINAILEINGLRRVVLTCLPATLHNRPELIAREVDALIEAERPHYDRIYCAYAECGTGGDLDAVLRFHGVPRIAGAHCYAFFAGQSVFEGFAEAEPGTFYVTDFLARNFETLILGGLGMVEHPELRELYFGNYRKLVYLAQTDSPDIRQKARAAAATLGLDYEEIRTGMGELERFIVEAATGVLPNVEREEKAPFAITDAPPARSARSWRGVTRRGSRARSSDRRSGTRHRPS